MLARDMIFAWPGASWLLWGALVWVLLFWRLQRYRKRVLASIVANEALRPLLVPRSRLYDSLRWFCLCAAWICLCLALMQPMGSPHYLHGEEEESADGVVSEVTGVDMGVRRRRMHEVLILVDTSASMEVADTRTGVTRLESAKEIAGEVIAQLEGQAVAVYAFTSQLTPVLPLNQNYFYSRLLLSQLGINTGDIAGTDLVEALEQLRRRHLLHEGSAKTVVMLTDGGDTRLEQLKAEARQKEIAAIASRLEGSIEHNFRVYTIGLGSQQGQEIPGIQFEGQPVVSTLDEPLLEYLADVGRGRYFHANQYSALSIAQAIYQTIDQDTGYVDEDVLVAEGSAIRDSSSQQELQYVDYAWIPLLIGILLLILALVLPEVRKHALMLLLAMTILDLSAVDQATLQSISDRAESLYKSGEYDAAFAEYGSILNDPLTPRQKRSVQMNCAMIRMTQGRWEAAALILNQMDLSGLVHPEIRFRALSYRAWSSYQLAQELMEQQQFERAIDKLDDALIALVELYGEGENSGRPVADRYRTWLGAVKIARAEAERQVVQERLAGDKRNLLKLTHSGLIRLIQQLDAAFEDGRSPNLPEPVAYAFGARSRELDPYWNELRHRFTQDQIDYQSYWFGEAESRATTASDALSEGRVLLARRELELAETAIGILSTGKDRDATIAELLQRRHSLTLREMHDGDLFAASVKQQLEVINSWLVHEISEWIAEGDHPQRKQLEDLLDSVNQPAEEPAQRVLQAVQDILLYRHLSDTAAQLLHDSYVALSHLVDEEQEQSINQRDLFPTVQLIKVVLRKLRVDEASDRALRDRVVQRLEQQVDPALTTLPGLHQTVEDALRDLSPQVLYLAQVARLINGYDRILRLSPISTGVLTAFEQFRNDTDKTLSLLTDSQSNMGALWRADFDESGRSHTASIRAIDLAEDGLARVLLKDARHWLRYSTERVRVDTQQSAAQLLADSIAEQQRALSVSEGIHQREVPETLSQQMTYLQVMGQNRVLERAQMTEQALQSVSADSPNRDPILELFSQGKQSAEIAKDAFDSGRSEAAQTAQGECVRLWSEALRLLREPENQQDGDDSSSEDGQQDDGSPDSQESDKQEQANNQDADIGSDELLQELQQMEQEDAQLRPANQMAPKRGLRPW